jgi:hypothetical protein
MRSDAKKKINWEKHFEDIIHKEHFPPRKTRRWIYNAANASYSRSGASSEEDIMRKWDEKEEFYLVLKLEERNPEEAAKCREGWSERKLEAYQAFLEYNEHLKEQYEERMMRDYLEDKAAKGDEDSGLDWGLDYEWC